MGKEVVRVTRALLSVSDKEGLEPLARRLAQAGVELVASGGTAELLRAAGLDVVTVEEVTGFPEILGGRVKTLHPLIHGGILADPELAGHRRDLSTHGIVPFQLVVANLYPFRSTVARDGGSDAEAVEQIDIGGVALIRAAAKNHARVGVVVEPSDYGEVADAVEAGGLHVELRRRLARRGFFYTAAYDAAVVGWLEREHALPERIVLPLQQAGKLRYGENPHQPGALYGIAGQRAWWQGAVVRQGKEMSFNNYADADAAWRIAWEFDKPAAVIVKHSNPCGVARRGDIEAAYTAAFECDPVSAFGGVVALNRPLDDPTARRMGEVFLEVVVAPAVTVEATAVLAERKNLRLVEAPPPEPGSLELRPVEGGFLGQSPDTVSEDRSDWTVVSHREPTEREWVDLNFAWVVAAHTKSNAIVVASDAAAVGIGAGDQSRVGASDRAVRQAGERARGASAASEALLPFRDGLDTLAIAGVTAVVEPGGSVRDQEVIAAADEHGVALVFTGTRHFRH